jgi:COP9 signalosome complex subunit 7
LRLRATTTATVLSELDQKLMEAATYSTAVQAENEEHEMVYQANLKDVQERQKDGKGGRRLQHPQNSIDSMDVDEPPSDGHKLRIRKHVSFSRFVCIASLPSQTDDGRRLETIPKEA